MEVSSDRLRALLAGTYDGAPTVSSSYEEDRAILAELVEWREASTRRETPVWRALIAACGVGYWYRDLPTDITDSIAASVLSLPAEAQAARMIAIAALDRALEPLGTTAERLAGELGEELTDDEIAFRAEVSRLKPPIEFRTVIRLSCKHGLMRESDAAAWLGEPLDELAAKELAS